LDWSDIDLDFCDKSDLWQHQNAAASALSMVTQNPINMVVVSAVSAAVLLGLLAAEHF
jgi:hypothetical protein